MDILNYSQYRIEQALYLQSISDNRHMSDKQSWLISQYLDYLDVCDAPSRFYDECYNIFLSIVRIDKFQEDIDIQKFNDEKRKAAKEDLNHAHLIYLMS